MNDIETNILACGKKYKELVEKNVQYEIEYFDKENAEIKRIQFSFTPEEFEHLTGIGKLKDVSGSSTAIYKAANNLLSTRRKPVDSEILADDIENSEYFYDDIKQKSILSSDEFETESETKKRANHLFKSGMLDRMYALENFYETMDKMQLNGTSPISLKMYHWIRTEYGMNERNEKPKSEHYYQMQRPHDSKVSADFLLEFCDADAVEKQYTNFFLITSRDNCSKPFSDVSIFRTDIPYSQETPEYKAKKPEEKWRDAKEDIIVLSVTRTMLENGKEVSETKTADSRVITECQKLVQARIEKQEQAERNREARKNPHEDEKSTATKVLRNLKATRCRDKDSKKAEYRKELCSLHDKTDYVLHEIRYVLENSCISKNNEKNREQMEKEIRLIDGILKAREIIAEMTAVEQETTENNFFEQAEKYVALQNSIRAEVNRSDMQTILCHNIAEMLEQHEISNADETVKSTISFEYAEKFKADIRQISEEKTGTVISLNFRKPAEFRNISSDGTAVMDMVSSLKQTFEEAGKQVMEYAEKLKCFLKKTVQFLADRFRKKHDDSEESAESPPNSPVKENNSHFSSEHEESEKQNQYVYLITEELELHGFFERTADGYSEIIAEKKFVSETEMQENLHWQGRVQEHICEEQNHLETELSCRKNSYNMEK